MLWRHKLQFSSTEHNFSSWLCESLKRKVLCLFLNILKFYFSTVKLCKASWIYCPTPFRHCIILSMKFMLFAACSGTSRKAAEIRSSQSEFATFCYNFNDSFRCFMDFFPFNETFSEWDLLRSASTARRRLPFCDCVGTFHKWKAMEILLWKLYFYRSVISLLIQLGH